MTAPVLPVAPVVKVWTDRRGARYVKVWCPFCSWRHIHGWPPGLGLPGTRVAHCYRADGGPARSYDVQAPQ